MIPCSEVETELTLMRQGNIRLFMQVELEACRNAYMVSTDASTGASRLHQRFGKEIKDGKKGHFVISS